MMAKENSMRDSTPTQLHVKQLAWVLAIFAAILQSLARINNNPRLWFIASWRCLAVVGHYGDVLKDKGKFGNIFKLLSSG